MSKGITVASIGDATLITADRFHTPYSIALDSANSMYIADCLNNSVQKWTADGIQGTTVAGQGNSTNGTGANALYLPNCVVLNENGDVYVSDSGNYRVQFWANGASSGTTMAGTGNWISKEIFLNIR
jgi:hypothetical protein